MALKKVVIRGNRPPQQDAEVWLEPRSGYVAVHMIDPQGVDWIVLHLDPAGVARIGGVSPHSGLPLDDRGRLNLAEQ